MVDLTPAEDDLGRGLFFAAIAAAFLQLPMIGPVGFLMAGPGFYFMIRAGFRMEGGASPSRSLAGLAVYLCGVVAFGFAATGAAEVALHIAITRLRPGFPGPGMLHISNIVLLCGLSAAGVGAGFSLRTFLPGRRILFWSGAVAGACFAAFLLFFLLAAAWPITA